MQNCEVWREIENYVGYYQISNMGRVKSLSRTYKLRDSIITYPEKILSLNLSTYGYPYVNLSKNNIKNRQFTHRLVAKAFISNPENKPCVNHKNGVRHDNRLENLEWCTYSENHIHAYRVLGRKRAMAGVCGKDNPKSKSVSQYTMDDKLIRVYVSAREASKITGISFKYISRCALGGKNRKSAGGFKWKFTEGD
jgi:hypothetical protein